MRKRIRLRQLQVGMYIEELEDAQHLGSTHATSFLVSSDAVLQRVLRSRAISVVINTTKGYCPGPDSAPVSAWNPASFEAHLSVLSSPDLVCRARETIEQARPQLYNLLSEARLRGAINVTAVFPLVDRVMGEATANAGTLISLAKLKDKDEGTFLHSLAVSALMVTFARSLGFDEQHVRQFGLGGLLHDIGKMTLPAGLLTKPGKLTETEMAIVRTHPVRGFSMLKKVASLEEPVLDICLFHHEKFDGTGYPKRLAGSDIPVAARIAAICDVYDALTTVRPYTRARSQSEAIGIMLHSSHGHFDPDLLKAFISKIIIAGVIH